MHRVGVAPAHRDLPARPRPETASAFDWSSGFAGANERGHRCAHEKGLAERRPDSGDQLWAPRRGRPGRDQPRRRSTALGRFGIRDRRRRLHHDQRARRERCAAGPGRAAVRQRGRDAGDGPVWQDVPGRRAHRGRRHRTGSGPAEDRWREAPRAAAGHVFASPAGRDRVRVRQPDRHAQQPDARAGVGRGQTGRSRLAADLRPDRCADQPRQLRRSAGQHPRRSRGRQHVHRVAVRRQRRPRLRDSERDGQNGVPATEAVRPCCGARKSA